MFILREGKCGWLPFLFELRPTVELWGRFDPSAGSKPADAAAVGVPSARGTKSKVTAALLCLFLGEVGAHKFYLGEQTGLAVLMLVLTLLGFVFLLPLIATCIWALVDLVRLLVMSDAEFDAKYNNR